MLSAALLLAGCVNTPPPLTESRVAAIVSGHGASGEIEARSLLGRDLVRPSIPGERIAALEANLAATVAAYKAAPTEENLIWVGRRLGYLGRFRDAVDVYIAGRREWPRSHAILRHLGHREITLRRFQSAEKHLALAATLAERVPDRAEPDGDPNPAGVARSTDRSNIYYHLGLARYLRGDYAGAVDGFGRRRGLASFNDDMLVSTTHWQYLALRRLGRHEDAAQLVADIRPGMDVLENHGYYALCLMYAGLKRPEDVIERKPDGSFADAGAAYGVAAYLALEGRGAESDTILRTLVEKNNWASFGVIAAEADLARR